MRYALGMTLAVTVGAVGFAYEAIPARSFTKPTGDGKHLFVMIVPKAVRDIPNDDLRAKYGKSGLYPKDDPTAPVWACEWYTQYESAVAVSNDAAFVVRVPDRKINWQQRAGGSYRIPKRPPGVEGLAAVTVYQSGKPLRTFTLRELFDCSQFTDADCDGGPVCEIDSFRDAAGRVTIRTVSGGKPQTRTIHFRTGEILPVGTSDLPPEVTDPAGKRPPPTEATDRPAPAEPKRQWAHVALIGVIVVVGCSTAFAALAVTLVRGQRAR